MSLTAEHYMARALELARRGEGRTRPNPAVGAVLVRDGRIVGEGFHPAAGQPHAEIFALREAGEAARGADLYVTLEPCNHQGRTGPCTEAILAAGVARVVVGTEDPNPRVAGCGLRRLAAAGIAVQSGVLAAECRRLIAPFAKHIVSGLPFITLKSAVTLDGKTATSRGDSQWISGPASREWVHRLRDRVDAIMVGIGTVLRDDPRLTTRLPEGGRDPLRVVVDSRLRLPEQAALLQLDSAAQTLVATTAQAAPDQVDRLRRAGAEILVVAERAGRVDLTALARLLGERGLQHVLLEGGAGLNAGCWEAGLVDRLMLFVAPKVVGGADGFGIFAGRGVERLAEARGVREMRVQQVGDDLLIEAEVQTCSQD